MNQQMLERVQGLLHSACQEKEIAGASFLFRDKNGDETFCAEGWADIENQRPIKRDTIFRLYSMSKPITAAAAMLALEQGLFDLADPVSRYLPGFRDQKVWENNSLVPAARETCLRDLLMMSSGLSYGGPSASGQQVQAVFSEGLRRMYRDDAFTTQEMANRLGQCGLEFQPGTRWMYGVSADIMGAVIEVAAGCSFREFMKKGILEPMEMVDTDFYVPENKRERMAKTYYPGTLEEYTGDNLMIQNRMERLPAFESGGAGLVSTMEDYSHFAQMLLQKGEWNGKRILSPRTVSYMTSPQLTEPQRLSLPWQALFGYSYGNFMRILRAEGDSTGLAVAGEYGWDGWLGPYFINLPSENSTLLMMMQRVDSGTWRLSRRVRNVTLALAESSEK